MNSMLECAPAPIRADLESITAALRPWSDRIAVFGSSVRVGFDRAGDVDIAVLSCELDAASTWSLLARFELSLPITRVCESYMGGGGISPKGYDCVVLRPGPYREYFVARHMSALMLHRLDRPTTPP
jgi:predicted nucleotidyltransferase